MTTTKTLPMQVRHQNWMLALRALAGVPTFRPVNESILFCATGPGGIERGMELARVAQEAERDMICAHWANTNAKRPSSYTVVLRNVLSVDVLSGCTAYMLEEGPLALVSTREKMTVWVGDRGLLQRGHGVPHHFARGARLAAARIRDAADGRDAELLDGNRFMPMGGEWTASDAPVDAPVRLS
ncbi:hypothetical protein [Sphingomonas sp. Marseille-Q8236]